MGCRTSRHSLHNVELAKESLNDIPVSQSNGQPVAEKETLSQRLSLSRKFKPALAMNPRGLYHRLSSILSATDDENVMRGVDKEKLEMIFRSAGIEISPKVFDMVFMLFDMDADGYVNRHEFVMSMAFLLEDDAATPRFELAFNLFDSDGNGEISKHEFDEMFVALIGTKLSYLLEMELGRSSFKKFLEAEHNGEHYYFWEEATHLVTNAKATSPKNEDLRETDGAKGVTLDQVAVDKVDGATGSETETNDGEASNEANPGASEPTETPSGDGEASPSVQTSDLLIPVSAVQQIVIKYIDCGSDCEVNISSAMRSRVQDALSGALAEKNEYMPATVFTEAVDEVIRLLEHDAFPRFKRKLSCDPPFFSFSKAVWEEQGIEKEYMSRSEYVKWAEKHPETFKFLDDMRQSVAESKAEWTKDSESLEKQSHTLFYLDGRKSLSLTSMVVISETIGKELAMGNLSHVNLDQLRTILEDLFRDCDDGTFDENKMEAIFDELKDEDGMVLLVRFLVALALVTNNGTVQDSKSLLFRLFDIQGEQVITEEEFVLLVITMVDLAKPDCFLRFKSCVDAIRKRAQLTTDRKNDFYCFLQPVALAINALELKKDSLEKQDLRALEDDMREFTKSNIDVLKVEAKRLIEMLQDPAVELNMLRLQLLEVYDVVLGLVDLEMIRSLKLEVEGSGTWPDLTKELWREVDGGTDIKMFKSLLGTLSEDTTQRSLQLSQYYGWMGTKLERSVLGALLSRKSSSE